MRSWASATLAVALGACHAAAAPPPAPPARPAHACPRIDAPCDADATDASAMAIVARRCQPCHAVGGIAGHDFPDAAALRRAPVADMLSGCQMPPDGAELPDPERRRLIAWATCTR